MTWPGPLQGALMICGTTSDAGKSTVTVGLCRLLARRGVRVAPFKAQNMALNSYVTPSGHEIGRAQGVQALAAGVAPEVAMNPILLKPTAETTSQVVVLGRPAGHLSAAAYHEAKPALMGVVLEALAGLRQRFDVVICEGAGSPAEINLLDRDIVNLAVAKRAGIPAIVVGDIDRGGVWAALYGTAMLLPQDLRSLIGGFVINKFRGDPALLGSGTADLERRCGVATLGVLPWITDVALDAEDSMALSGLRPRPDPSSEHRPPDRSGLDVACIRLPRISNFTDLDALALEPGVAIRFVDDPASLGAPDLIVLPGTKATADDLDWLRRRGLAEAILALANQPSSGVTVLGICGGYQMLGQRVSDPDGVEAGQPSDVVGLGLLAAETVYRREKLTRQCSGHALGQGLTGYEIHHGITESSSPWIALEADGERGTPEGCASADGRILGTNLHGLFESDAFRDAFLGTVAARRHKRWAASAVSFSAARERQFDRLADLLEAHLDLDAVEGLIARGALHP